MTGTDLFHHPELGGEARLAHGDRCVLLQITGFSEVRRAFLVLTADEADRLAAAIQQQAAASRLPDGEGEL